MEWSFCVFNQGYRRGTWLPCVVPGAAEAFFFADGWIALVFVWSRDAWIGAQIRGSSGCGVARHNRCFSEGWRGKIRGGGGPDEYWAEAPADALSQAERQDA